MTTDPEAIEQVLINLLINAAQAADKEDSVHPAACLSGRFVDEPAGDGGHRQRVWNG